MQKKKHKVTKQVYRVKKDGRLGKNSDLTQRIEKRLLKKHRLVLLNKLPQMLNMFQII